jgi:thiamine-monophosphate kinase
MPRESDLVQRYFPALARRGDVLKGIGDDGAVVRPPPGSELVATLDTMVEGVHFLARTSAISLGHKALAVNLSDLAAMGAEPAWILLGLTLPRPDEHWLGGFSEGLLGLADRHTVELVGGDLTRGPLAITVQATGVVPSDQAILRSGAQPGDSVFVTGTIGDAGLALAAIRGELELTPKQLTYCLSRLNEPLPRVAEGLALRTLATAAIDVSDGLASDLERITSVSGVGARVELTHIPLSSAARAVFGSEVDWNLVLSSGDDYELLFTAPTENVATIERQFSRLDCDLSHIGYIEAKSGLRYAVEGALFAPAAPCGYDHFAD